MLNGRKTIGIILFDITGYYQQQLVHTLSKTASKHGVQSAYFLCLYHLRQRYKKCSR